MRKALKLALNIVGAWIILDHITQTAKALNRLTAETANLRRHVSTLLQRTPPAPLDLAYRPPPRDWSGNAIAPAGPQYAFRRNAPGPDADFAYRDPRNRSADRGITDNGDLTFTVFDPETFHDRAEDHRKTLRREAEDRFDDWSREVVTGPPSIDPEEPDPSFYAAFDGGEGDYVAQ